MDNNELTKSVVCGGTFDLFHKGHKEFLRFAFSQGNQIIIGLTTDKYVQRFKNLSNIEPFEIRKKSLEEFIQSEYPKIDVKMIPIDDIFGPTLSDNSLDTLILTEETKKSGDLINDERRKRGLPTLKIVLFKQILATDGKPITSTRIKNGEIGRDGKVYIDQEKLTRAFILPDELRQELKKPFGELIVNIDNWLKIKSNIDELKAITVGDVVTKKFNDHKVKNILSIIDFKVARSVQFASLTNHGFDQNVIVYEVKNLPGTITNNLFFTIKDIFTLLDESKRHVIVIDGEEDLAVLPVILTSPLGFSVFYGQPNEGVVKVNVNEDTKEKVYEVMNKFKRQQ